MSSGKTVQVHLAPHGSQIYGDGTTARLPFGLKINALQEDDFVTFSTMDLADPYHPLMDNIDVNAFQGFDANSVVAESVLSTNSVSTNEVPAVCGGGYMENGGEFQRIIRSQKTFRTPLSEFATISKVVSSSPPLT